MDPSGLKGDDCWTALQTCKLDDLVSYGGGNTWGQFLAGVRWLYLQGAYGTGFGDRGFYRPSGEASAGGFGGGAGPGATTVQTSTDSRCSGAARNQNVIESALLGGVTTSAVGAAAGGLIGAGAGKAAGGVIGAASGSLAGLPTGPLAATTGFIGAMVGGRVGTIAGTALGATVGAYLGAWIGTVSGASAATVANFFVCDVGIRFKER